MVLKSHISGDSDHNSLVSCTSDSYTLRYSFNIGIDVIKLGSLVYDAVYVCCSGLHVPIAYSLLGGGIPITEQRLCGTLYSVPLF